MWYTIDIRIIRIKWNAYQLQLHEMIGMNNWHS